MFREHLFVVFAESLRRSPVSYTKMVTLKLDDRLLAAYLFYGSILMLKTWAMSFFTARHRLQNKVRSDPYVATGVRHLRIFGMVRISNRADFDVMLHCDCVMYRYCNVTWPLLRDLYITGFACYLYPK